MTELAAALDLRGDFTGEEFAVLLLANAGISERAGRAAGVASERFVALALDGSGDARAASS